MEVTTPAQGTVTQALTALGALAERHGPGVPVPPPESGDLLETCDLWETFGLTAKAAPEARLVELLEVRRILESAATSQAAARIDDQQLAEVAVQLDTMDETSDAEEFITADVAFHQVIARAAGNEELAALIDQLSARTFRARLRRGQEEADALAGARADHARIYRALQARDPETARTAAAAHVRNVEEWLRCRLT
ncbi:FadR/GntR family transcriptional regulator [Streptomyces sp. NPDC059063]|uniref:FadR/GntR family transcriptional regulator n=1 Tax=unclassified Streptomyces TaxID=2593676 RepID=UPI00369AF141